jgi:hypothetical protein
LSPSVLPSGVVIVLALPRPMGFLRLTDGAEVSDTARSYSMSIAGG